MVEVEPGIHPVHGPYHHLVPVSPARVSPHGLELSRHTSASWVLPAGGPCDSLGTLELPAGGSLDTLELPAGGPCVDSLGTPELPAGGPCDSLGTRNSQLVAPVLTPGYSGSGTPSWWPLCYLLNSQLGAPVLTHWSSQPPLVKTVALLLPLSPPPPTTNQSTGHVGQEIITAILVVQVMVEHAYVTLKHGGLLGG